MDGLRDMDTALAVHEAKKAKNQCCNYIIGLIEQTHQRLPHAELATSGLALRKLLFCFVLTIIFLGFCL